MPQFNVHCDNFGLGGRAPTYGCNGSTPAKMVTPQSQGDGRLIAVWAINHLDGHNGGLAAGALGDLKGWGPFMTTRAGHYTTADLRSRVAVGERRGGNFGGINYISHLTLLYQLSVYVVKHLMQINDGSDKIIIFNLMVIYGTN